MQQLQIAKASYSFSTFQNYVLNTYAVLKHSNSQDVKRRALLIDKRAFKFQKYTR